MEQNVLRSRKQLSNIMFIGGALGLVFGGIHLWAFLSSGSSTSLSDAAINVGLGLLGLLGGWLIAKGKLLAILIEIPTILVSLAYSYFMGRGVNLVMLALGGLYLAWMIVLWRRGGLS